MVSAVDEHYMVLETGNKSKFKVLQTMTEDHLK